MSSYTSPHKRPSRVGHPKRPVVVRVVPEIKERLKNGNLCSHSELKFYLVSLVRAVREDATQDFSLLFHLDDYRRKVLKDVPISSSNAKLITQFTKNKDTYKNQVETAISAVSLSPTLFKDSAQKNPTFAVPSAAKQAQHELLVKLHMAILRLAHIASKMRYDRMQLVAAFISDLELNGKIVMPPETEAPKAGTRRRRR
eukprot:gnl/Dysnectes_brevis/2137_a2484_1718.p1 GENE.gnl/Dysnectes_brevis/2137_a2484_1718~~gnl/Dysnectes_brevis/2137_a2484_1718.p1  ORF type:complete len:199 (+),score=25.89 gnl/Dysnectes_brevis/2137_a2484_1718:46-642(+)